MSRDVRAVHRARRWIGVVWPPLVVFVVLHLLWEALVRWLHVSPWMVPAPSMVLDAALHQRDVLAQATLVTTEAAVAGFAASVLVGIAAGVMLSTTRLVERAFYPFTVFLQTVPLVAIAPLLVLWVGPGIKAVAVSAFIVSLFPVIANTVAGMRSVDPALRDLFRLYGGSRLATLLKLKLPWALPDVFTGLRVASGLAVIGAVVGEFVTGSFEQQGLGLLVESANRMGETALIFAAVAAASLLGLAMFGLVNLTGYLALRRWHASARD